MADVEFPEPWFDGSDVNGYRIEPILACENPTRYAHRPHNCASTYAYRVASGNSFVYAVLEADTTVAMVKLNKKNDRIHMGQLSGPYNDAVSRDLKGAVNAWFKGQATTNTPSTESWENEPQIAEFAKNVRSMSEDQQKKLVEIINLAREHPELTGALRSAQEDGIYDMDEVIGILRRKLN